MMKIILEKIKNLINFSSVVLGGYVVAKIAGVTGKVARFEVVEMTEMFRRATVIECSKKKIKVPGVGGDFGRAGKIATQFFLLPILFTIFFSPNSIFGETKIAEAASIDVVVWYLGDYVGGKTVKMAVGTSTPSFHTAISTSSTSTVGSFAFFAIDDTYLSSTTPFVFWLSGDSVKINALYSGWTAGNIGVYLGFDFDGRGVSHIGGEVSIDDFSFIDSSYDSDILYTFTTSPKKIVFDSDILIVGTSKFIASKDLTVMYSLHFLDNPVEGFFDANGGTIDLVAEGLIGRGFTGSNSFHNLIISSTIGMNYDASTTNLTITESGVLYAPDKLTIKGNFNNQGTFVHYYNGTIYMESDGNISGGFTGSSSLHNLIISSTTVMLSDASTTNLTITESGVLTAPSKLTIKGNFNNQGTFNHGNGTIYMENKGEGFDLVAGRDVSGSAAGTVSKTISSSVVRGNYLFI